jgi:N-acetylmuramic acid 6-phosphate etherase
MANPDFIDPRLTEQRNPKTVGIDVASSGEIVDLMHDEDRTVADAVYAAREELVRTIDLVVDAFNSGGRLVYVGAGTSGRLGVLDATECPPTFGSPRAVRKVPKTMWTPLQRQ